MTTPVKRWSLMSSAERDVYAAEVAAVQRAEQGLPPTVQDPLVLDRVARILTAPAVDELVERAS